MHSGKFLEAGTPLIQKYAHKFGIDTGDLEKQLLLHLPRLTLDELCDIEQLRDEASRLAAKISDSQIALRSWSEKPAIPVLSRKTVEVRSLDPYLAQEIYQRFHYIGILTLARISPSSACRSTSPTRFTSVIFRPSGR